MSYLREIIYSAIFTVYDDFTLVWFEPSEKKRLIKGINIVDSYSEIVDFFKNDKFDNKYVIHLNEMFLLHSLSYGIPSTVLDCNLDIFQNITTNSVEKIVKFLESIWTVNKPDYDKFVSYSSGYTLSNNTNL